MWADKYRTTTRPSRRGWILVVTAGLVLSILMLGTSDQASAQSNCVEDVQVGQRCEVVGPAPTKLANELVCGADYVLVEARCVRSALAESAELTCPVGILVVDQCVEETSPSLPSQDVCPTSPVVFSSDGECYMLVPKIDSASCPLGSASNEDDTLCLEPVPTVGQVIGDRSPCPEPIAHSSDLDGPCTRLIPASIADPACPPAARGNAGACYEIVNAVGSQPLQCPSGSSLDDYGLCRQPVHDLATSLNCPYADAALVGSECVWTLPASGGCAESQATSCEPTDLACPDGFMIDAGLPGFCTRSEPASQNPASCPEGAHGTAGNCYILVVAGPGVASCETGELVGSVCVVRGDPPVERDGALQCAAGFGLIDGECVRYEPALQPPVQCPSGSVEDDQGDCRKPVQDVPGTYFCEDSSAALQGTMCVFVAVPFVGTAEPCPDGYEFDGQDLCVRAEPAVPSGPPCPAGTYGTAGDCFVLVALSSPESTCERGVLVAPQLCRQPVADLAGRPYCEDPTAELRGAQCVIIAPDSAGHSKYCPTGFPPDESLGGLCTRFEPASQQGPRCPEGTRGEPGGCYILVARGPGAPTCSEGTLVGGQCVVVGDPPMNGPGSCAISATVLGDADFCYTLVPAPDGGCAAPLVDEPSNDSLCRSRVDLRPGPLMCASGYGIIDGQCITYVSPTRGTPACPEGTVADDAADACRRRIRDSAGPVFCVDPTAALNGTSCVFVADFIVGCNPASGACIGERTVQVCPVNGGVVEAGDECAAVRQRVATSCPVDTTLDPNTTSCRKPVPLEQGAPTCPAGFAIDGTSCIRLTAPRTISVVDCGDIDASLCDAIVQSIQQDIATEELVAQHSTKLVYFGCPDGIATYELSKGTTVTSGQLTETSTGIYVGVYEVPTPGSHTLTVLNECPDGSSNKATGMLNFVDPSGLAAETTPTVEPTLEPTATPTVQPTATPTVQPTATPTVEPTTRPRVTRPQRQAAPSAVTSAAVAQPPFVAASTPVAVETSTTGSLAFTGSATPHTLGVALSLTGSGLCLLAASRRRRTRDTTVMSV